MEIRFCFSAYGILTICALAMILTFLSVETGHTEWASSFFNLAALIALLFIFYMFVKMIFKKK